MLNYLLVSSCSRADLVSDDPLNTGRDSTTRVAVVLLMQSAYIYPSLNYTVLDKEYNQLIALHTTMCFQSLNCCYRCLWSQQTQYILWQIIPLGFTESRWRNGRIMCVRRASQGDRRQQLGNSSRDGLCETVWDSTLSCDLSFYKNVQWFIPWCLLATGCGSSRVQRTGAISQSRKPRRYYAVLCHISGFHFFQLCNTAREEWQSSYIDLRLSFLLEQLCCIHPCRKRSMATRWRSHGGHAIITRSPLCRRELMHIACK